MKKEILTAIATAFATIGGITASENGISHIVIKDDNQEEPGAQFDLFFSELTGTRIMIRKENRETFHLDVLIDVTIGQRSDEMYIVKLIGELFKIFQQVSFYAAFNFDLLNLVKKELSKNEVLVDKLDYCD